MQSNDRLKQLNFLTNSLLTNRQQETPPEKTKACLNRISGFINPQDTETANESKLKPMPIKRKVMNCVSVIFSKRRKNN
jgi:hypothetical protein